MATQREYCQECGRARRALEWACPDCDCGIYTHRSKSGRVDLVPLCGPLVELPGIARGCALLLYGGRGGGKSTVALMSFERPWVLSTEMEPALIRSYADRLGVDLAGACWVEDLGQDEQGRRGFEADLPEPGQADGLVLDSLNGEGTPESLFHWAQAAALKLDLPLIVIAQVTADHAVRGGEHVPHLAHVVVCCRSTEYGRELEVEKNRFGATSAIPWTMPGEQAPPYAYVVEGRAGRYTLKAYPWASSPVWDAVQRGDLERPSLPAAASAVHSELYRGFVEPPDWQARARFCAARGVPYYKVGYGEQN